MPDTSITTEQKQHLEKFVAGIGHNQGPALEAHADALQEHVSRHHGLKAQATSIRVMLDMMRSHLKGEYLLPETTAAYVFGGAAIVGAITTGLTMVTQPVPAVLLDGVVIGFVVAALRGDMEQYVSWRAARDPAYKDIKNELFGAADRP